MCMINLIDKPTKQVVAYKVLMWDSYKKLWRTPCEYDPIKSKTLIAKGKPSEDGIISGGAIHCFKTEKAANQWKTHDEVIFKVVGKGLVGHSGTEIAFKEIEFVDDPTQWEWDYK